MRMSKSIRTALPTVLLTTVLLSGCAALSGPHPGTRLPAGQLSTADGQRQYHASIQLSGKISLHYEKNHQQQDLPASFLWEQQPGLLRLSLFSPLGQTLARITQTPGLALLEQDGKPPKSAADLDQLLADTLQWPLPLAGLQDWLQGCLRSSDGQCRMLAAEDQTVRQDGWTIRYLNWHPAPAVLPRRIDLNRYTSQAGPVSLNIFIEAPENPDSAGTP